MQTAAIMKSAVGTRKMTTSKFFFPVLATIILSACGPKNYDECVLKEMDGRKAELMPTAERYCEAKFPFEKDITEHKGIINLKFHYSEANDKLACVSPSGNTSNYKISKAMVTFHSNDCNYLEVLNRYENVTIPFDSDQESRCAVLNFQSKCMTINSIYGTLKK